MPCEHAVLTFTPSAHAEAVGFKRATAEKLVAATIFTGRYKKDAPIPSSATFPAVLILPDDDLALDPHCPPQSLRSWLRDKDRNPVLPDRNVIYVTPPPDVDATVEFVQSWTEPRKCGSLNTIETPQIDEVIEYLSAFYHGLPVKPFPLQRLSFTAWETTTKRPESKARPKAPLPNYIGLNTSSECVGIRTRASRDGFFVAQLNLDDLLDAAISMLPEDAYALILLVNHDLYESDDDVFICGRAYGGSRVAVISTARYHPLLDHKHNVNRMHAWPASHCADYVYQNSSESSSSKRPKKKAKLQHAVPLIPSTPLQPAAPTSPMYAALSAFKSHPIHASSSPAELSGLWLGRVCRTASHELGHCFGMDHCVYYACSMQGSACLAEDSRQPPYLCPVDLTKVLHATGATAQDRLLSLLSFCERHRGNQFFASYSAWIQAQIHDQEGESQR